MPSYKELKLRQLKKKYETQYGVSQQDADLQASRDVSKQEEENDKGNVWQQIIGGIGDISNNFAKGFFGLFEGIIDAGAGLVGLFGDEDFKKGVQDFQNIDIADNIVKGANLINPGTQINNLITTGKWYDPFDFDNDNETNDVTEKSFVNNMSETGQTFTRGLAQALGQVTGQILTVGTAGSLGASANVAKGIGMGALGASSFGSGMSQANQEGASFGESFGYGLLNAGKEVGTELLVGKAVSGITGVPSAVGGALAKGEQVGSSIFSRFQNKAIKSFANEGAKKFLKQIVSEFTEEGLEEAVGSLIEPVIQKVTYKKDKSVSEIFEENGGWGGVLEDFLVGGISGGIAGGVQTGAQVKAVGKQLGSTTVKGNFEAYGVQDAIAQICDIDEQLGIELLKIKGGLNENIDLDVLKDENSVRDFVEKYAKEQGKFTKEGDINNEAKKIADLIKQRENIQNKFTNAFEEYAKQQGLELDNMADANGNVEVNETTLGKLRAIDTKNQFNERATATKETLVKEGIQKVFGDKVNVEFGNTNNFDASNNKITLNKNSNDSVAKLLASLGHESEHKFGTKKFRTQMLKAMGITETQLNDMANKYALRKGRDSSGKFTNYEKLFKEYAKNNNIKEGTQEYNDARKEYFKDEIVADLLGVYVSNNIDELQRSIKRSDAGLLKRGIMNIQDLFKGHEAKQFRKAMNYFAEGIKEDTKAQNNVNKEAQKNTQTNANVKPAMTYSLDDEEIKSNILFKYSKYLRDNLTFSGEVFVSGEYIVLASNNEYNIKILNKQKFENFTLDEFNQMQKIFERGVNYSEWEFIRRIRQGIRKITEQRLGNKNNDIQSISNARQENIRQSSENRRQGIKENIASNEQINYSLDDDASNTIEKEDELLKTINELEKYKKTKEYSNLSFNEKENKKINKVGLTKYLTDAEKEPFMKEMKLGKETRKLFDANKAGDWILEQLKDKIAEKNGEIVLVEEIKPKAEVKPVVEEKPAETTKPEPTTVETTVEVKPEVQNAEKVTTKDLEVDIKNKPNEDILKSKMTVTQATKFIQNVEQAINQELLNIENQEARMYEFTTLDDYNQFEKRGNSIQNSFKRIEEYRKLANKVKNSLIKTTTQQSKFEDTMDDFTRKNKYQGFDDDEYWNKRSKNFDKKFEKQKEANKNTDFNAVSADLVSKQFIKDEFEKLVNQNNRLPQSDEATILKRKIREELNDYNKSKEEKVKKMLEKLSKYYNDVRDNLSGLTDTKKRLQNDLDRVVSTLTEEQLNNEKVKEKIDSIKQKIDNLSSSEVVKVTEDKNGKLRSSVETMYDRELAIRAEITGNAFVKKSDLTNEETYTQTGNGLTDIADKAKPKEASTNDNLLSIVEDYELDEVFKDGSTEDNHLAYNIYKVESYLDENGIYSLSAITNADGREKKSIKSFHKNFISMFKNIQKGFNKVVGYIDESISNFEDGSEEDIKYYLDLIQSMADSEFLDEEYIDNAVDFIENYNTELKEAQDFLKSKEVSKAIEDKDLTRLNELLSKNKYFKDKSFSETADAKTFIEKVLKMETINEGRYDFTACYDIIAEITEYAETNDFKSKHIQELIENKKRIVETEKSKKKVEKVKKNEVKEPKVDGEAVVEKVNLEPNNAETKETVKDVKPEKVEKPTETEQKPKTEKKPKETKPKAEKPKKKKVSGYYVDESSVRRYYEKDRVATETANTIKNWAEVHKKVVYNQNAGEAIVNLTYSVINKKGDVVRFVFNNRKLGTNGVEFVMLDILKVLNEYQVEGDVSNEAKIDQIYEILKEGIEVITLVPQFDSKGKLKGQYETFTKLDENIEKEEYVQKILTTLRSSIAEIVNNASKPTILVTKLNQLSEKYNADLDKLLTKVDERLKAENELNEKIYKLEKQVIKGEINEKNLEKEIEKLNKELDKVSKQNENYEKLKEKFQKISEELRKKYREIAKINRTLQRNLARSQRNNTTLRTTLYGEKVIKGNFDKFISKDLVSEFFDASDVDVENYDQIALYVSRGEFDTASQLYAESLNIKLDDEYYKVSDILSDETYTEFITYTKEAFEEFAKNSPQSALSMWKEKYSKLKESYKSKYKDLKVVAKISNQLGRKFKSLNNLVYTKGSGTQSPVLTQFRALVQMLSNPTVNKLYNGKVRAEFKRFYNILQANAKTMQIEVPEMLTSLFEDVINNENSATLEEIEKYTKLVDGIADYIERSFTDKNYTLIDDNGNEVKKKGSEIATETIQQQKNLGKEKFNGVLYNTSDPRVFIQHIDGGNKEGFFHRMYNRFFKGQYVDKVNYWRKLVLPYNEFKNSNKKFIKSLGQNISITIGGKDIEISKGEALYLAEILTDDDAVKHAIKVTGGIEINSEIYKMDEAELDTFKENLNNTLNLDKDGVESQYIKIIDNKLKEAGQIKYVTDVGNYGFSNVSVLTDEDGNPIDSNGNIIEDLKNNYDKLVLTKKYFPMIVSDLSLSQSLSNGRAMQQVVAKAKQFRFNYDRTSYNGALRLADVDDIISNHLEQMTTYGALSGVIIDFNNIYNHKMSGDVNNNIGIGDSIGSVTKARFGQNKNGKFYVDDFLKGWTSDIQGMSRVSDTIADSKIKKLISGVRSRFAKFALLANIKVAMTQTASYFGALKYVNAKYLAKAPFALSSNLAPLPSYYQFRNKTNTVSSAYTLSDSVNGALDKLGILINKADALTVKTIWKAICLQEGITKDTDVNSDKYKKAEALWLKTVAETQPMYDSFSRSRMLNTTSELAKMFLMFQTQNNKNWSNIVEMITNKVGGKQIVRTTAGISLAMLAFAFMSEFFKHFVRDDDDDDKFFDTDLLAQGLNSIIGAIPVVGSQIQLNFNNGFPFELNEMSIGALTNINKVIENGNNLFTNGFGSLSPKDYIDTVGMLSGVPTNNIWNLYNDIVRITAQTTKNQSIADFYANQNVAYKGYAMTNKKKVSEEEVKGNKTLSKAYYKIWSNKIMPLEDKTIDILYDLYKKGVDVNYKTIPNSYNNEYNEDVAIDKKAFQKTYKGAGEKINQLQSSIRFSRLNDNQKVKAISKIFDTYYNLAKKKQTGEKLKLIEALADSNYNLANTISYLVMIDDLEATKTQTRKQVVQKYINRIPTTSQNKYIIYMLSGYKVPDSKKRMVMNYLRRYLPLSYIKDLLEG